MAELCSWDVAEVLSIAPSTVREWERAGMVEGRIHPRHTHCWLINEKSLNDFLSVPGVVETLEQLKVEWHSK